MSKIMESAKRAVLEVKINLNLANYQDEKNCLEKILIFGVQHSKVVSLVKVA